MAVARFSELENTQTTNVSLLNPWSFDTIEQGHAEGAYISRRVMRLRIEVRWVIRCFSLSRDKLAHVVLMLT